MLHDIFPHVFSNTYENTTPAPHDQFLLYRREHAYICLQNGEGRWPRFLDFPDRAEEIMARSRFVFRVDNVPYFLCEDLSLEKTADFTYQPVTVFRTISPGWFAFAGITGNQFHHFYRNNRFCGHCGGKTVHKSDERAIICGECGKIEYPRISPAVIVAITHGDKLLLARGNGSAPGSYGLIAGFAETGEPIEGTVRREVMEEVGLSLRNLRFYKSQPWPFSDSLLFGFFAEVDGDPTIKLDPNELAEAVWMTRDGIPPAGNRISLTREMIDFFCEHDPLPL